MLAFRSRSKDILKGECKFAPLSGLSGAGIHYGKYYGKCQDEAGALGMEWAHGE
jgi:hypothetical protein